MRRSFHTAMSAKATRFPTYDEYPKPIAYTLPFTKYDWIGFRQRWSQPGMMVTQADLARWLGMHVRQVGRYENGSATTAQVHVMALRYLDAELVAARQRQAKLHLVPDFDFTEGEAPELPAEPADDDDSDSA